MNFREDLEALVLAALTEGPAHGYEIAKRIREKAGKTVKFGDSRLYPVLHKLEEGGSLVARWEAQEGVPNRKIYELSEEGHAQLRRRREQWEEFSRAISSILNPRTERAR